MKLKDAMAEIEKHEADLAVRPGYRVRFQRREGGMLVSDHFPARDEEAIPSEDDAWQLAQRFAATDPDGHSFVNIFVIHAHDWTPVKGYVQRELNGHPKREAALQS